MVGTAFLRPAPHLREQVGKHRDGFGVAELMVTKRLYAVSAATLLVRLRDLGIITQQTLPAPVLPALSEGLITISKVSELLGKSVAVIDEEMRGAAVTDRRQ
jgi:hypothetical protein